MARTVQTGTRASRAKHHRSYCKRSSGIDENDRFDVSLTGGRLFLTAERRERRKSKAGFCAMARAVQTSTRASRAKHQRGYCKRSSSAGKKKAGFESRPKVVIDNYNQRRTS